MASTYTLNNGIELIGTGEQSGTWGDTTNTNLSLLDTALDGQVTVTLPSAGTSGSPNTLAIADGSASDGRNRMVIFNDGGDLGATAYVQLTPNDAEKIIYIRNDLAGSRSIILFQGTYNASNDYEVPAGTTAVVYFDGAGSGAVAANVFNNAYFDSLRLGSVSVTAIIDDDTMATASATNIATSESIKAYVDTQVGANNELSEVLANGNTSGGNAIQMTTTDELQFRDTALKISSSADGQLDIDADTEIEIVAPTVDIDASTEMTIDTAALTVTGAVDLNTSLNVDGTITGDGLTIGSTSYSSISTSEAPTLSTDAHPGEALWLRSGGTSGSGNVQAVLGFGKADGGSARTGAAIASIQTDTDADRVGLAFYRSGSAASVQTMAKSVEFSHNGDITFYDTSGNASFVYDESAGSTFNEQGDSKDFRVESDTNTHMLFVDAANNRLGVGSSAPSATLDVAGDAEFESGKIIINEVTGADAYSEIRKTNAGSNFAIVSPEAIYLLVDSDNDQTTRGVVIGHNAAAPGSATSLAVIAENGTVFNEPGADIDFRVESSSRSNALVLDGGTGNLALNTTNSDFYTGFDTTSIKLGPVASMWSLSNGSSDRRMTIDQNLYVNTDGTNRYLTTGAAARYQMNTGTHRFETAPSGSDDAQASDLAVQMLILNSGDVRMGLDNSTAQELNFRTSSSAGRKITKSIKRGDSGASNAMVQMDMLGYGTNGYLGQMNMYMTPSDVYNSTQIDMFSVYATTGAIFNEDSQSYVDFRVESDSQSHALFVDASHDTIGVGTSSVSNTVAANFHGKGILFRNNVNGDNTNWTKLHNTASTDRSNLLIQPSTGSVEITQGGGLTVTNTATYGNVFNEGGVDADFRVESDNKTHMLFIDASLDAVQIGSNMSQSQGALDVGFSVDSDTTNVATIRRGLQGNNTSLATGFGFPYLTIGGSEYVSGGSYRGIGFGYWIPNSGYASSRPPAEIAFFDESVASGTKGSLVFGTRDTTLGGDVPVQRMRIHADGKVTINETGTDSDFRVESDTDTHAIFVDAGNNRVNIHASSGENLMNLNAAGVSSHTSGTLPPGLTLYNSNTGNGTGNAITWKDATGAQGIAGIASFRTGTSGGYSRDLRFYVNNVAATNAFQEGMRLHEDQMLAARSVGWSVNTLVEPTVVATSEASSSGSIYIDYYLDSATNQWSTAHFFMTISQITGGAASNSAAWYLVRAHHYNGAISFSIRDSGGDTGSFTTAFSDSGGTDPIAARIGFTSLAGTAVLNVMGANYFGVQKVV